MRRSAKALAHLSIAALLFSLAFRIFTRWPHQLFGGQAQKSAPINRRARQPAPSASSALQSHRNLGKAYYEQGKYVESIREFQKVTATGHALATDHLDLGLALLQSNDLDAALGELTTAKQMDPQLVAAEYNLGILYKRELRYPDAEAALKRVIAADSSDPAAWFNLGSVLFAERKLPQSLEAHQHVVSMGFGRGQNFYVAALFHVFTALVRLKRQAEAQSVLKIHEAVRDKVPSISLQNPALEAGKYGAILVPPSPLEAPVSRRARAAPVAFDEITARLGLALPPVSRRVTTEAEARKEIRQGEYSLDFARRKLVSAFDATVALGDYDGDGRTDLYVTVPGGENHLLHNDGDGKFTDVTARAGVAGDGSRLSAAFADYDNSGRASLFVAGLGGVRLYQNNGDGTFTDATEKAGLKGNPGDLATRAVLFDADADGFLDLVVTTYTDLGAPPAKDSFVFPDDFAGSKVRFYRNNGDGSFTDASAAAGLGNAQGRWRSALFADFDNDGYADLLLLRDDGSPQLWINQGEGKFAERTAEAGAALAKSRAVDAQAADFNHDGNFDLALWTPSGYQVLLNRGGGKFEPVARLPAVTPPRGLLAFRGTVADVDGGGFDDLLAAEPGGHWRLISNRGGRFEVSALRISAPGWPNSDDKGQDPSADGRALAAVTPAWLGAPGKMDLVATQPNGQLAVFEKAGPPARWLEVRLDAYKSNKQGTGTIVELKAGNFYKKVQAAGEPLRVFTGGLAKLDVVRVTWPNQIVQNNLGVATNSSIQVRESERLASSCPFLYVWDGKQFVFFTDILGVAPLGELLPDGSRLKPNPEEFVRLGSGLRDEDGLIRIQITDELREVDYLDQVRLVAVDHPASEEIYANEIYSSTPTPPHLYRVREKRFPVAAVDGHGADVLPLVRAADGLYPTGFRQDRILGLAELHTLTLDLGDFSRASRPALWLKGWVFWTDSNASRALESSRSLQMVPPRLQVRDSRGEWVTAIDDMGLPSGTNRAMRVDLAGKFPTRDHHVRIVTNLCVYWDQIFLSLDDTPVAASARLDELPLVSADLHYRGFSTPASDAAHQKPDSFDYVHLLSQAPWNPMRGAYTRYGPVAELVRQADDRLVVMATGDEATLEFSARKLAPLPNGWSRDFFLYVRGYAKDGEPNTSFAQTVDPLPFFAMPNYPPSGTAPPSSAKYHRYLGAYETRPRWALIPPLAPNVK